jgi:hypothetical protein
MQNLKAVTMGVVAAIALFWSNKPNPAMHGGDGMWQGGNVENEKCGVTWAETKRNMGKRTLRWLDA